MSSAARSWTRIVQCDYRRHHKGWMRARPRISATGGIRRVRLPNGWRSRL